MIADHESEEELQTAFEAGGVSISSDQLRRWRDQGLMPRVTQHGLGRALGSVIHYPIGTARLALEIDGLLSIKKKLSFVGWHLWMQGYEVSDRYWKPALGSALADLRRIPAFLRLKEMRNRNKNETIFDQFDLGHFRNSAFAKGVSRLSKDNSTLALALLSDVAIGSFDENGTKDQSERDTNRQSIFELIGQSSANTVAGLFRRPHFEVDIMRQLQAVTKSLSEIHRTRSIPKFEIAPDARIEFFAIMQIANQLNSTIPAFGKSPIGRFAKPLSYDQGVQAYAVVIWSVFREMGTILPPDEIVSQSKILTANPP